MAQIEKDGPVLCLICDRTILLEIGSQEGPKDKKLENRFQSIVYKFLGKTEDDDKMSIDRYAT